MSSYAHAIYGGICGGAGKPAEAIEAARRAVELDSESYVSQAMLQLVLHLCGQFEESIAAGDLAVAMSGRHSWAMATEAMTFSDWGKRENAEAIYAEMLARARLQYVPPSTLAVAAAAAAREEEAISHAREAFEIGDPTCIFFSKHWPATAQMRACPRFRKLLSEVGFE